jgi:hypothetical protein
VVIGEYRDFTNNWVVSVIDRESRPSFVLATLPSAPSVPQHSARCVLPRTYYFAYNFIKIHRTLRMSPAMAAGVTDRLWSVEDLVALWKAYEQRRAERAA